MDSPSPEPQANERELKGWGGVGGAHQMEGLGHRVTTRLVITAFHPGFALYFPQCRHPQEASLVGILPPDVLGREVS